jgi:hypothetical protein
MNRGEPRQTPARRIGRLHSTVCARCDTGYGKPPRQQDILGRKIEVRTGSTLRKMTLLEDMLTRFAESALKSRAHLFGRQSLPSSPASAGGWRHG